MISRAGILSLFMAGLLSGFAACTVKVEGFAFTDISGAPVPLTAENRKGWDAGGGVSLGKVRTVDFTFTKPLEITEGDNVFTLKFQGGGPGALLRVRRNPDTKLKEKSSTPPGPYHAAPLPIPLARTAEFSLPLSPGSYSGFSLELDDGTAGPAVLHIIEAGIQAAAGGAFTLRQDHISVSADFFPSALPVSPGSDLVLKVSAGSGAPSGLEVRFRYPGELPREGPKITLTRAGASYTAAVAARPVPEPLYFHTAAVGFFPEEIKISSLPGDAEVEVRLIRNATWTAGSPSFDPIPADLTTLLEYPQKGWRHGSFEVFRWGLFPEVLIFDTENYAAQKRLFHRLAFFTEKKGYRGRLMPDSVIWDLHGWNAHNYHAEGLAAFFEAAREKSFPLNTEEIWLRDYLLSRGLLIKSGTSWRPGRGGVLSISRESLPAHRRLLMTHEAFHGVYYGIEDFRKLTEKTWKDLPSEQKDFWKFFFSWMNYDIRDPYLVANEFQAYLLQQPLRAVDPYFKETVAGRLVERYPERKKYFDDLFRGHPDMFSRPARTLSDFLEKTVGIRAGDAFSLRR
jgi:hypothetical protein